MHGAVKHLSKLVPNLGVFQDATPVVHTDEKSDYSDQNLELHYACEHQILLYGFNRDCLFQEYNCWENGQKIAFCLALEFDWFTVLGNSHYSGKGH